MGDRVLDGAALERGGDDEFVEDLLFAVDGDGDFLTIADDLLDLGVEEGRVGDLLVEGLVDGLGAIFPGPEVDVDEVHHRLEVEVFEDVGGRDFIEIAIAERGERANPDLGDEGDAVDFAEFVEREGEVLEVRVDAFDGLTSRGDREAFVTAFGDAEVAADVVAFVLGFEQAAHLLDLALQFEEVRDAGELFVETVIDAAIEVLVGTVEFRAVMGDAGEFFDVVNRIVGGNTHDGAHLIAFAIMNRRVAFAAHVVGFLINHVILVSLFLEIHRCR